MSVPSSDLPSESLEKYSSTLQAFSVSPNAASAGQPAKYTPPTESKIGAPRISLKQKILKERGLLGRPPLSILSESPSTSSNEGSAGTSAAAEKVNNSPKAKK